MSSKASLKTALDGLISDADAQIQLHESSRQKLYLTLGGIYLWWREASKIVGFLDELYEERKLQKRGDEENFTRIIRLVYQLDWGGRKAPTLQLWSKALKKIHAEFESNKDAYKVEPQEKIRQYIDSKGGIKGVLGIAAQGPIVDEVPKQGKTGKSKADQLSDQAMLSKHFELGEQYFSNEARSLINIDTQALRVAVTRKGYALALVKRKANSKYQILSITNDDDLVRQAIISTYKRKADATPYVLRLLGEVIETQSLPLTLERHRASLYGTSDVVAANGDKMKQIKRLMLRSKTKDILLSESRNDCSVVTIASPREFPVVDKEDLFLRIENHRFIENEIVQSKDMSFFTTLSKHIEVVTDKELVASHVIRSKNSVTGKIRNLYFYRLSTLAEDSRIQSEVDKHATTAPLWQATVDKDWIDDLYSICVSNWLREYGPQINRPKHKQIQLELGKKKFWMHHYGERGNYTQVEKGVPNPTVAVNSKPCAIHLLSKDIFPVLSALAHQDIDGKVRLMANADMFVIHYKTELATYSIAVPSCTNKGKPIKTAFKAYGA